MAGPDEGGGGLVRARSSCKIMNGPVYTQAVFFQIVNGAVHARAVCVKFVCKIVNAARAHPASRLYTVPDGVWDWVGEGGH